MLTLDEYFDKILVINLEKRKDRWEHFQREMDSIGVRNYERIEAYEVPIDGRVHGNFSCTASHRGALELIAHNRWETTLVFEDDSAVRSAYSNKAELFNVIAEKVLRQVPADWEMLYLGGSYAENPKRRVNENVIEANGMMTTSSYAVTWKQAKKMAPHISGIGPIDSLYHKFNRESKCYCIQPRLFVQYSSYSDLTESDSTNEQSMLDERHENMLLEGTLQPVSPNGTSFILEGKLQRRELAAHTDMNGEEVIVDGKLFSVVGVKVPQHLAPWFRGEPVTYYLLAK